MQKDLLAEFRELTKDSLPPDKLDKIGTKIIPWLHSRVPVHDCNAQQDVIALYVYIISKCKACTLESRKQVIDTS